MSETKFIELQKQLFRLFEKGKFDDVLSLINQAQMEFPERLEKTSFWRACVFSVQGEIEKAISSLHEALEKGVWWNPQILTRDPDLSPLQNVEEFKMIVKKCEDILENQKLTSQPRLYVYGNQHSDIGIFSLHWRGSNVNDFAPYWFDPNTINRYLFGFPQSSQLFGFNAYCWDNQETARKDIFKTFREFKEKYSAEQVILAGASQGGKLSIELSLDDNILDTKGFIAIIPAVQNVSPIESIIKTRKKCNLKGCIITGDKDPYYSKTLKLMQLFEVHGIPCKWIVKEGLGHDFPDDFTSLLQEAVDYILKSH